MRKFINIVSKLNEIQIDDWEKMYNAFQHDDDFDEVYNLVKTYSELTNDYTTNPIQKFGHRGLDRIRDTIRSADEYYSPKMKKDSYIFNLFNDLKEYFFKNWY